VNLPRACRSEPVQEFYAYYIVRNIAHTAAAINSVAIQPTHISPLVITNCPMMSVRTAIRIIKAMMGTEITPFITALQKSALIGSTGVKPSAIPTKVEMVMIP
jgi:hypothetical protein